MPARPESSSGAAPECSSSPTSVGTKRACRPQSTRELIGPLVSELGLEKIDQSDHAVGAELERKVELMDPGDVLLLGNSRFSPADEANDAELASALAELCDTVVFDAWGTAHREQASTTGVMKLRPSYCGRLMEREIAKLQPFIGRVDGSVACVGGKKLKEKVGLLPDLIANGWQVILGGVPLNVALAAQGFAIGDSLCTEGEKDYTSKMSKLLADHRDNIVLPEQIIITDSTGQNQTIEVGSSVPPGWKIVDVVPGERCEQALKEASRVLQIGPMGMYDKGYGQGDASIVAIMKDKQLALAVGSDTIAATRFSRYSTGGGSTLHYLSKGTVPVLEFLQ